MQFFGAKAKAAPKAAPKRETLAPEPSFNLQLGLLGLAGVSGYAENYGLAGFLGLLGVFLTIQATRIRCGEKMRACRGTEGGLGRPGVCTGVRAIIRCPPDPHRCPISHPHSHRFVFDDTVSA